MDTLLAGDLTGEERRLVRCHIRACRKCREEYRLLKAVVQSMADLPFHEPSAQFNANVLVRLGMEPSSVSTQFPVWAKWLISGLLAMSWLWVMFLAFAVRTEFLMWNGFKFILWIKNGAHVLVNIIVNAAETMGPVAGHLLQDCAAIFNPLLLFQILAALVIAPVIVIVGINGIHLRAKAQEGMLC